VQVIGEAFPDVPINTINVALRRMVESGVIEKAERRGFYAALSGK